MTILVTGANGTVSAALLQSLYAVPGVELRALVRDADKAPALAGVQVAVGDLDEPDSLTDAFRGVDTLWLLTAMGPQAPHQNMNAVWAARQAGVSHIVRQSAVGAAHDAPTRNGRLHAMSDEELMASGIDWTIIKPHSFMQNLLGSVGGDTLYGLDVGHMGMIDARDVAEFAARVLIQPQSHAGRTYTPTGPASVSLPELAATLEPVLGTPITYQPVSPQDAHAAMIGAGVPAWNAAVIIEYGAAYASGWGDFVTADFPDVMGRQARTFAQFAHDHAARLRAA